MHALQALARRGFQALHRAVQLCGPAGAHQCPLEAILEYDVDALRAVRELVVKEMSLPVNRFHLSPMNTGREMVKPSLRRPRDVGVDLIWSCLAL